MSQTELPHIKRLSIGDGQPLRADEIHLYVLSIPQLMERQIQLAALINEQEQQRAARFLNPQHGDNYRCIRGQLRQLLGHYLDIAPAQVAFEYAEHGKPYLKHETSLQFNISHSRDMAAFAFGLDGEVGVDIEYMRPQKNLAGMIRHVASPGEQQELSALSGDDQHEAFYRLWARKESLIKGVGRGLGMGLRSIHIGSLTRHEAMPVSYKDKPLAGWYVIDQPPPKAYKLAISCSVTLVNS